MAVQPLLLDLTRQFVGSLPAGAKVTIDGKEKEFPIFRSLTEDSAVKKYIYIDHDTGFISKASLVDDLGRELDVKEMNVEKGEDGFMIVFILDVTLKEGTQ